MREVMFRGKCITTGKWYYGGFTTFEGKEDTYIIIFDTLKPDMETGHQENIMTYIPVDHKTVGQFTGIQSDSRIGLYEGDKIIFGNSETTHVIEWSKAFWLAKNIIPNSYHYTGRGLFCDDVWGIKIIGNIHENPELLK